MRNIIVCVALGIFNGPIIDSTSVLAQVDTATGNDKLTDNWKQIEVINEDEDVEGQGGSEINPDESDHNARPGNDDDSETNEDGPPDMVNEETQTDPVNISPVEPVPEPEETKEGIHPSPDPEEENDEEKDHLDIVDIEIKHLQDDQVTKIEMVIFGIIMSIAGCGLAFLGVQVLTAAFGLICTLICAYILLVVLCAIF